MKVKDRLLVLTRSNVLYSIPCSYGKVYICETERRLGKRMVNISACSKMLETCCIVVTSRRDVWKHIQLIPNKNLWG